jgi:hypothetical protein
MSKCDNCEFKDSGEECYAEAQPKLCELKNTIEAFKTAIRDKTLEKAYPSLKQQMFNAGQSMIDIIKNPSIASKEKQEYRLNICHSCEWFDKEKNNCKNCGCHMPLKIHFEVSKCPLDPPKWG